MELKFVEDQFCADRICCSNRTFMELKLTQFITICGVVASSNRTFMELKFVYKDNGHCKS